MGTLHENPIDALHTAITIAAKYGDMLAVYIYARKLGRYVKPFRRFDDL